MCVKLKVAEVYSALHSIRKKKTTARDYGDSIEIRLRGKRQAELTVRNPFQSLTSFIAGQA